MNKTSAQVPAMGDRPRLSPGRIIKEGTVQLRMKHYFAMWIILLFATPWVSASGYIIFKSEPWQAVVTGAGILAFWMHVEVVRNIFKGRKDDK